MRKACMIVHSYYPADPRVRRETEALLANGWAVDVICLRNHGQPAKELCGGATVYRLPVRRHRGSGLAVYLLEYLVFFVLASIKVTLLHLRRRYNVVQAHNMPDFLAFTALLPKLMGARVVLDIHDVVPELYMIKFGGREDHKVVRLTRWFERVSTRFADYVLTAGAPFRRRLLERGVPNDKLTVIMNSADPRLFTQQQPQKRNDDGFTLIHHGSLFERNGLDIAIRAVDRLRHEIPNLRFNIYGQGEAEAGLADLVRELDLRDHVKLGGFVSIDAIPALISSADLGVIPLRKNSFNDLIYPTKAFEYLAMGVPVIMARTEAVVDLFADVPDMLFTPEQVDELADRILMLYREPERRQRLLAAAQQAYIPYEWENQRRTYVAIMNHLADAKGPLPRLEWNQGEK
jgi:glycosyltransferase involved in cell wall biosynthesis